MTARDKHHPIGQQCACVVAARLMHAAAGGPCTCRRIIQFCARHVGGAIEAAGDEHLSTREECGGVKVASGAHAACCVPTTSRGHGRHVVGATEDGSQDVSGTY